MFCPFVLTGTALIDRQAKRGNVRTQEGYYRDTGHVYVMEGLTFDLNTGNEITLADVFADNVDYLALLNNAVMKDLNEVSAQDEGYFTRWHGLKLAESLKDCLRIRNSSSMRTESI